ncbi:MAG: hypothetical protein I8H76_07605 [Burkholderiales bacterium]|nr:hypothetical protein [Burkholderiales bacterium]MBH2014936.1 hypothetical protein [Burkholderiales bacterium]
MHIESGPTHAGPGRGTDKQSSRQLFVPPKIRHLNAKPLISLTSFIQQSDRLAPSDPHRSAHERWCCFFNRADVQNPTATFTKINNAPSDAHEIKSKGLAQSLQMKSPQIFTGTTTQESPRCYFQEKHNWRWPP